VGTEKENRVGLEKVSRGSLEMIFSGINLEIPVPVF
jgi:hypothetical protein